MFIRSFGLGDMCLEVIVRNLEKFVFCKTVPQKHIDFLFRVYSEDVFRKYKSLKRTIKEEVMLWFLNPHAKKVTVRRNSEKITKQLQIIGFAITSLNLQKSSVAESDLSSIICSVPHVTQLDLSYTSCTDETLLCIKNMCSDLITLNLSYCNKITCKGMKNLCGGNLSLKSLNILANIELMGGLCIILNEMPSLECVKAEQLVGVLIEMRKFAPKRNFCIRSKYNLTELFYDGTVQNNPKAIKTLTKRCPKLRKLHFQYEIEKNALEECVGFQNLEELKMKLSHSSYSDIPNYDVLSPILPISHNLKTLILSCVEIPTVTLVECFRNLEKLYLKKCTFTVFKNEDITITETKLDTLVIKETDLTVLTNTYKAVAMLISLSRNVTKLQLSRSRELPHDIFDVILNSMKNLTLMNFFYTNVKLSSLTPFFDIPSLKMIYANCFEESNSIKPCKSKSCTLSWRCMYDSEDNNDTDEMYDDDDSISDHVLSEQCCSSDIGDSSDMDD